MTIVVTGMVATYPLGGVAVDYLAYVEGFQRLGLDVFYLEDPGHWFYDPRAQTFTDDVAYGVAYLAAALSRLSTPAPRWAVRGPDGTYHGTDAVTVERICAQADLFLNVSGACWLRPEYRGARRTAYLDTDPGYSQAKVAAVAAGTASADDAYSVGLIRAHDTFFTLAENIHDPACRIPAGGLRWCPTRQPVVLEDWPFTFAPAAPAFTTVMSWKTDVTPPSFDGVAYGGKDVEFLRFIDLPARTPVALEVAVSGAAPQQRLRGAGWRVVDGFSRSHSPAAYRDYLRAARGEWSVAKNAYVATGSGWFSTRTAVYLACGKPAVVQDTGWSRHYPTGEGLFAFSTVEEAVDALERVDRSYLAHCDAARAIAEREFAAPRVLERLLRDAGL